MSFTSTKVVPSGSTVTITNETLTVTNVVQSLVYSSNINNTNFSSGIFQASTFTGAFTNGTGLQRGFGATIVSGGTTASVVLPVAMANTSYGVYLIPNYTTTVFVSAKSTSSFLANFGTATAISGDTFDWLVIS